MRKISIGVNEGILEAASKEHIKTVKRENRKHWIRQEILELIKKRRKYKNARKLYRNTDLWGMRYVENEGKLKRS